jgi:hypothetical protein
MDSATRQSIEKGEYPPTARQAKLIMKYGGDPYKVKTEHEAGEYIANLKINFDKKIDFIGHCVGAGVGITFFTALSCGFIWLGWFMMTEKNEPKDWAVVVLISGVLLFLVPYNQALTLIGIVKQRRKDTDRGRK